MKALKSIIVLIAILLHVVFVNSQTNQKEFPALKGPYLGQKPPGTTPEIFAPDIVSTDLYNHGSLSISPDGQEIYWAMAPLDTPLRIYVARLVHGLWTKPEILSFTLTEDGDCPILSYDGKKIFFNSNRPITQGGKRRERVWFVERTPAGWSTPACLGPEINNEHLHWQVSVDRDGNLYVGSERRGSKGQDDIFFARYDQGTYSQPISLDEAINTVAHESTPFVAPDGSYLIFARDGMWISFKNSRGQWTDAVKLDERYGDCCPYVSPDGKYYFFKQSGIATFRNVYWVLAKFIEELRPKEDK